jgi:subtilisin-like proprotein convertase family protein
MKQILPAFIVLLLSGSLASAIDQCAPGPATIPDNDTGGVVVEIEIDAPGELVDSVSIDLEMLHSWVGDLVITLQSPSGSVVTLLDRPGIPSNGFPGPFGCGGQDVSARFFDGAPQPGESMCSTTATPVLAGDLSPSTALGVLAGEPAEGTWLLKISDQSPYDTGMLIDACLHIDTSPACIADLTADGVLDIFDVLAFVEAYNAGDPSADFTGDGGFDIFDVLAFVEAYNAGCL